MIPVLTTSFAILSKFQSEAELERVPPAAEPRGGIPRDFAFRLGNDLGQEGLGGARPRGGRVSIAFRLGNDSGLVISTFRRTRFRHCLNCLSAC